MWSEKCGREEIKIWDRKRTDGNFDAVITLMLTTNGEYIYFYRINV